MGVNRVPPHSISDEEALLGAMLNYSDAVAAALDIVDPSSFYQPSHALVWDAVATLYLRGERHDETAVASLLGRRHQLDTVGGTQALRNLSTRTTGPSSAPRHARIIEELATCRRLIAAAAEIADRAYAAPEDIGGLIDSARQSLAAIDLPGSGPPADLYQVGQFLKMGDEPDSLRRAEWVIPGVVRRGWRVVVVASEGIGKSVALRMLATGAATGVHPFTTGRMEPVTSLIVDVENPPDVIRSTLTKAHDYGVSRLGTDGQGWIWNRINGLNLRTRTGRNTLDAILRHVRPDLVCMGPLYKLFRTSSRESDELAAGEVQAVLDDFRERYQFALVLEHHAPKAVAGRRDLVPFGSSLWQRWPEMGVTMSPHKDEPAGKRPRRLVLRRYRGDRVDNAWPDELHWGEQGWPYVGWWQDGLPLDSEVMF